MKPESKTATVRSLDRINLRLAGDTFGTIDAARAARPGKFPETPGSLRRSRKNRSAIARVPCPKTASTAPVAKFYEFFAGGGVARKGIGPEWTCLFANDCDFKKGLTYQANFGSDELKVADIRAVTPADLPGVADLMWGSFPCQDLSLAGVGTGLKGERSSSFYPLWDVVRALRPKAVPLS